MATADTQPRTNRRRDTRKLFIWLDQVKGDPELSPVAFLVAYEIGQHFNSRHGGAAWPSSLTIASDIRMSQRSVLRAAKLLEQRGHLKIDPGKPGRGHSNRYFMVLQKGPPAHLNAALKPAPAPVFRTSRKPASEALKPAPAPKNYLEPPMGTLSAFPIEERERSLSLAHPPGAPAPVGGAPEKQEVIVDRFAELWTIWSSARSWPDSDDDEAAARRAFALACSDDDIAGNIIAAARAWIAAVEPRFLAKLSKWLTGRGWEKQPPARRQRRGGKPALAEMMLRWGQSWARSSRSRRSTFSGRSTSLPKMPTTSSRATPTYKICSAPSGNRRPHSKTARWSARSSTASERC
jgi:hypothetical protein